MVDPKAKGASPTVVQYSLGIGIVIVIALNF